MNRLESLAGTSTGAAYKYRADGMRVNKVEGYTLAWVWNEDHKSGYYDENWDTNQPTTRYFYDGQMAVEEDFTREIEEDVCVDVTKYGIGARGIDLIAKDPYNAAESQYFPIYDGSRFTSFISLRRDLRHGNSVALLARDGGGFAVTNRRAYDAWGNVRQGYTTGEPKQRYCANLGHVQDDESGLQYMRARYYEPWTGRFVSPDPDLNGPTLFSYCKNDPVNKVDESGKNDDANAVIGILLAVGFLLQKLVDLSIKYLTPWLITVGVIMYTLDATSSLPIEWKAGAFMGNSLFNILCNKTVNSAIVGLEKMFAKMMVEAGPVSCNVLARALSNAGAYFIALGVYTLLIGIDA